jgi:hypothetical protein
MPPVSRVRQTTSLVLVMTIEEVAGDPGHLRAAEAVVPDAAAAAQIDRRHDAAIADRDHPVAVDHRPAADVGQGRDRVAAGAPGEIVAPERAPVTTSKARRSPEV